MNGGNGPADDAGRIKSLEDQLEAVRHIGEALGHAVGLDALFERVVPNLSQLLKAERSTLFLHDEASGEIWSKVAQDEGGEIRLQIGHGIAGWVAEHGETVNIADVYDDPRFNSSFDLRSGFRTQSVAAVPLCSRGGEFLGVLQVLNHRDGAFGDEDIGLLTTIAVQMGYAVENAQLAQQLLDQNRDLEAARYRAERRRAELDLLYQLEQEAAHVTELDELLDSVIIRTGERLRSAAGSVFLLDQDIGRLFFRRVSGEKKDELKKLSLAPGEGVVGWVAQSGKPVVVNRPDEDPRHYRELARKLDYPVQALLAVPLVWDDQVVGAMEVINPRPSPTGAVGYDDEDLKVLTLIVAQVSRAVALIQQRQARIETERLAFLGQMLAGVAHDLRNPMTVISGYAQFMVIEDEEEAREARCERVLYQIDEMAGMIADLLAFARGDTQLRPMVIEVEQLADELRETLELQCKPRRVTLGVNNTAGTINIDIGRVKRIINNLAKNAIEALDHNGELTIDLAEKDHGLKIRVADTGPGIPVAVQDEMFQPFRTAGKSGGTGLGLAIVKRFVDDHGGTINIETAPGEGTTFFVALPAVAPAGETGGNSTVKEGRP